MKMNCGTSVALLTLTALLSAAATATAGDVSPLMGSLGAQALWAKTGGNCRAVTVAILDSGIDTANPYLKGQIKYVTVKTRKGRAVTTLSGYSPPAYGANIATDEDGHGTSLAGVIAGNATGNGPKGLCYAGAQLMPIKVRDFISNDPNVINNATNDFVASVNYIAKYNLAQIVVYASGAMLPYNDPHVTQMQAAVAALGAKGILFITAAGNDRRDKQNWLYQSGQEDSPTMSSGSNVLQVGGLAGWNVGMSSDSDYGASVMISAPGSAISTTWTTSAADHTGLVDWGTANGSSYSSAFMGGVAALYWSAMLKTSKPNAASVISAILSSSGSGFNPNDGRTTGGGTNRWVNLGGLAAKIR